MAGAKCKAGSQEGFLPGRALCGVYAAPYSRLFDAASYRGPARRLRYATIWTYARFYSLLD